MSESIILKDIDPRLNEILKDTYYQIIYQEQVMIICMKLAGYSMGQADKVRKTVGRKIQSELDELIPDLYAKFVSNGVNEKGAKDLAKAIELCGSYCFNKSHAVEYGLISYQTAYLKANYPLQYMCSLLNGNMDDTDSVVQYINECKKMGIEVLPPSIQIGNLRFIPEGKKIRMGLSCIKGIQKLEYKLYPTAQQFFFNNNLNKRIKEALIKSGAMDCFGIARKDLLCMAMNINEEIKNVENKIKICKDKIISKNNEISVSKQGTKKVHTLYRQIENLKESIKKHESEIDTLKSYNADYNEVQGEIDTLGFTFKDKFSYYNIEEYQTYNPDIIINQTILADIIDFKKITDKKGRLMAFVKVQPFLSPVCELVMFSNFYQELDVGKIYVINIKNKNQIVSTMVAKIKT